MRSPLLNSLGSCILRCFDASSEPDWIHRKVGGLIDPLDICQIVFGSFFARVEGCWPQVESMDQLTALMIAMGAKQPAG